VTATVFSEILEEVVKAVPGARGAIFVDWEGEAVDTFSTIGTTAIKLVGAHWGIVYYQARSALEKQDVGAVEELILTFADQQVIIRRVTDEYMVIMTLQDGGNLGRALGKLDWAITKLREEM
jgi:predicted regulator of Ras-like GTPase activity (Roadblock/LC7/MglB family)